MGVMIESNLNEGACHSFSIVAPNLGRIRSSNSSAVLFRSRFSYPYPCRPPRHPPLRPKRPEIRSFSDGWYVPPSFLPSLPFYSILTSPSSSLAHTLLRLPPPHPTPPRLAYPAHPPHRPLQPASPGHQQSRSSTDSAKACRPAALECKLHEARGRSVGLLPPTVPPTRVKNKNEERRGVAYRCVTSRMYTCSCLLTNVCCMLL